MTTLLRLDTYTLLSYPKCLSISPLDLRISIKIVCNLLSKFTAATRLRTNEVTSLVAVTEIKYGALALLKLAKETNKRMAMVLKFAPLAEMSTS